MQRIFLFPLSLLSSLIHVHTSPHYHSFLHTQASKMTQSTATATINPLDLPEIRLVLADVLPLHALTVCARVSKDWNRSFKRPLWRHISLRIQVNKASPSSTRVTTLKLATKHKELIQNLTIHGNMSRSSKSNLSSLGYFCIILTIIFVFVIVGLDVNEWRVRQRKELWSAIPEFPILRSLELQQTGDLRTIIRPESIRLLKPRFSSLNCLDFHPYITLESESYEEILSSCPQLWTLRGGNVKAKVLTEGRPWVCTILRHWSLCLDFGATEDYHGNITDPATGPASSASSSSSSTKKEVEQQVEQMREEVRRQLFERMSLLGELESVDFRQQYQKGLSNPLRVDHNDSGLERLLQCPRLKELKFDWDESESETYHWIRTHWQKIEVNSLPASEDEDEGEDDEDLDGYGSDDCDSDESDEYGYREGRGPYCAKCDEHGCSHYAEVLEFRHKERRYRDYNRRW